jgi:hypothetical protein
VLLQQYADRADLIRELAVHDLETKMPTGFAG